jgi:hypothetical protein
MLKKEGKRFPFKKFPSLITRMTEEEERKASQTGKNLSTTSSSHTRKNLLRPSSFPSKEDIEADSVLLHDTEYYDTITRLSFQMLLLEHLCYSL